MWTYQGKPAAPVRYIFKSQCPSIQYYTPYVCVCLSVCLSVTLQGTLCTLLLRVQGTLCTLLRTLEIWSLKPVHVPPPPTHPPTHTLSRYTHTGLREQISEVRELLHNRGESLQVLIKKKIELLHNRGESLQVLIK